MGRSKRDSGSWLVGLAGAFLAFTMVQASGEGAEPPSVTAPAAEQSPEEQAIEHYNLGVACRDRASKLTEELTGAATDKERDKLRRKIAKQFESAIDEFTAAVQKNPSMHKAWSELGYALRKSGRYEDALGAYDEALRLNASYAPAIEYRAEAFLGLNRVEDAKSAYIKLFGSDRARADELMRAMRGWIDQRRSEPGGVDEKVVDSFTRWVRERTEIADQTPPVSQLRERGW